MRVECANSYGYSRWGHAARIFCRMQDGEVVTYFQKSIKHDLRAQMTEADFESLKALHSVSPKLTPCPYAWGQFKNDPNCHFMLVEFREIGSQPPEPGLFAERIASLHKKSASPTGKFGFHMKTLTGSIPQHNDEWSDSWDEIFSNTLGHLLDLDDKSNKTWPELEHVKYLIKTHVIPRLLRSLQSDGRTIKPCLVHGDLWNGNTATDVETGEPFIFDPVSFYAHNENEIGSWKAKRHMLSDPRYVEQYCRNYEISEPRADWDARNILYSLTYNTNAAILYHSMNQRDVIFEDMKNLCTRFCHDELRALLQGDSIPKLMGSPNHINHIDQEEHDKRRQQAAVTPEELVNNHFITKEPHIFVESKSLNVD